MKAKKKSSYVAMYEKIDDKRVKCKFCKYSGTIKNYPKHANSAHSSQIDSSTHYTFTPKIEGVLETLCRDKEEAKQDANLKRKLADDVRKCDDEESAMEIRIKKRLFEAMETKFDKQVRVINGMFGQQKAHIIGLIAGIKEDKESLDICPILNKMVEQQFSFASQLWNIRREMAMPKYAKIWPRHDKYKTKPWSLPNSPRNLNIDERWNGKERVQSLYCHLQTYLLQDPIANTPLTLKDTKIFWRQQI
jgi:hypothetical protein